MRRLVGYGVFALLCGASLLVGAREIDVLTLDGDAWLTLTASRLPRLAALVLTGVGLAVCGVILQHILRNKFVEPGTTGGLDAAKLGILVSLGVAPAASSGVRMLFALVCCFAASVLFLLIIRRIRFHNSLLVPVIGLMYGGVLSAIAEFYAYRHNILQSMQGWLLGDFSKVVQGNYEIIYVILPIVALAYLYAQRFTVMGMGEGMATSLGLNYAATAALGLLLVAVTVAATVITIGSIPFVGLVIPHAVRLLAGTGHGRLLPASALGGALFLIAADVLSRTLIKGQVIPVGVVTALVGAPVFALILIGRRHAR